MRLAGIVGRIDREVAAEEIEYHGGHREFSAPEDAEPTMCWKMEFLGSILKAPDLEKHQRPTAGEYLSNGARFFHSLKHG